MSVRKIQRYGYIPDLKDHRDLMARFHSPSISQIPTFIDLRSKVPYIYDQGSLGSCTANAISANINFELIKQGQKPLMPARLFIYFNERKMEGTINQDSGAQIRDGFSSIANQGVCPETDWPYIVSKFAVQPPANCYTDASKHIVQQYLSLNDNAPALQDSLAAGFPFVFGFTVYESFESDTVASNGIVPMPKHNESIVGGHAVMGVGYNATNNKIQDVPAQTYIVQNSWGNDWGAKGFFFLPFSYIHNAGLADDFWTVRLLEV